MSTKIYTGFQIATSSVTEVIEIIKAFRPGIEKESRQILKRFIDTVSPGDTTKGWMAWMEIRKGTVQKGIRMPAVDTGFNVVLFPDGDRFLGIAYTDQPQWYQAWLTQPKVSEFGYWNNTDDTPEGVSFEDFRARREVWDRVVGHDVPAMRGFSIQITDPNGPSLWKLKEDEDEAAIAAEDSGPAP